MGCFVEAACTESADHSSGHYIPQVLNHNLTIGSFTAFTTYVSLYEQARVLSYQI